MYSDLHVKENLRRIEEMHIQADRDRMAEEIIRASRAENGSRLAELASRVLSRTGKALLNAGSRLDQRQASASGLTPCDDMA